MNRVRFFGRIRGRPLRAGLYAIEVRVARGSRAATLKQLLVSVSRHGAAPARRAVTDVRWSCESGAAAAAQGTVLAFSETPAGGPLGPATPGGAWQGAKAGVAGAVFQTEKLTAARRALPAIASGGSTSTQTLLVLALLAAAVAMFLLAALPHASNGVYGNGSARGRNGNGTVLAHLATVDWRAIVVMVGTATLLLAATLVLADRIAG